jgi:hypothetical protein
MEVKENLHLSYCTNIHSGETWEETFRALKSGLPGIKKKFSNDKPMGVGLRLSAIAAEELLKDGLEDFKNWLNYNNLYIFTINGFPYGRFHDTVVKDNVHRPDWTTRERVIYTKNLFTILKTLAPGNVGVSTSPISYRGWHKEKSDDVLETAATYFIEVVDFLVDLETSTGKLFHLDIEPEPDGMLENSKELISFFENYLLKSATNILAEKRGISAEDARILILRHIQVCYDVCHFALVWERPEMVLRAFREKGIKVGKIQVSSALEVRLTDSLQENQEKISQLKKFQESTYLHQVSIWSGKEQSRYTDLPEAIVNADVTSEAVWRIHYHVPVFQKHYGQLSSTQEEIIAVLDLLKKEKFTHHLEVETYTWDVLPDSLKENLEESIFRELDWVKEELLKE